MTQIITGKFKNRRLYSPDAVRPTKRAVREGIFSALGALSGCSFLDLCAGTGSVGCEALSRGASPVTLVDAYTDLSGLKVLFPDEPIQIIRQSAHKFLKHNPIPTDIIYLDPPWNRDDLYKRLMPLIMQDWLAPGGRLLVEMAKQKQPLFTPIKSYYYGNAGVHVYA